MASLRPMWCSGGSTLLGVPIVTVNDADTLMGASLRTPPARRRVRHPEQRERRARGAPPGEERLVHWRRARRRHLDGTIRRRSTLASARAATKSIRDPADPAEVTIRLDAMLRRSDRDLYVHPSTRLPGAVEIEAEIGRRLSLNTLFATCYADLDHFKEFNDRYSYYEGDRVIRILAQILHDVVKGVCREEGFVGHIGGDDFIYIIPLGDVNEVCAEIVSVFDTLIPFQYSEPDRRAGYFFGKDRRGQLHRVPLMTVSIGVVTNERRRFTHAAQVSALATEMKSYAKTLPGSVFSIDRRTDAPPPPELAGSESRRVASATEAK